MIGHHNALNACAAILAASNLSIPIKLVRNALADFEDAYLKLKDGPGGIEALGNYVAACIKNCNKITGIIHI